MAPAALFVATRDIHQWLAGTAFDLQWLPGGSGPHDFRERAAIFDHTVRVALSPPHTSKAPGFATQDHAQARRAT